MKRKEVNRCWREWFATGNRSDDGVSGAEWAEKWAEPLLAEVRRLRTELRLSNKKRRRVRGDLELERDDLDKLIDDVERLRGELPADPLSDVSGYWVVTRLDEILAPFMEDHEGKDEESDDW
jgi:hypothetical protein